MKVFSTLLLHLLLLTSAAASTTAELTSSELDAALFALRSNGYTLFPNAIATSDLHVRLLSSPNSSFTLFSPPDSLLFSLDLLSSARLYTFSLLLHVSPHWLSTSDLLSLGLPYIETLHPRHHLLVEKAQVSRNGSTLPSVSVDGVRVSVPDLFLGSNIVVHGLDGILVARYRARDNDGAYSEPGAPAMAPKIWCHTCISPANPPESSTPTGSRVPETVSVGTGVKKDGGSDKDDNRGSKKGSRHSTFFHFKHLFTW